VSENHHCRAKYFWCKQYCAKREQIFGLYRTRKLLRYPQTPSLQIIWAGFIVSYTGSPSFTLIFYAFVFYSSWLMYTTAEFALHHFQLTPIGWVRSVTITPYFRRGNNFWLMPNFSGTQPGRKAPVECTCVLTCRAVNTSVPNVMQSVTDSN